MEIIEKFTVSKTGQVYDNEDAIVITDDFVCIIDGTTSKSDVRWANETTGKLAAAALSETIYSLHPNIGVFEIVEVLNTGLQNLYHRYEVYDLVKQNPTARASASLVIYSKYHRLVWMLGDCQGIVNGKTFRGERSIDVILSTVRALYIESELQIGKTIEDIMADDSGRTFIKPLLQRQAYFQNSLLSVYSYFVLDGFEVNVNQIQTIPIDAGQHSLILASDGYPVLKQTLAESEVELKNLLDIDPLCFRSFKSTKGLLKGNTSFDDRAYVKIAVR